MATTDNSFEHLRTELHQKWSTVVSELNNEVGEQRGMLLQLRLQLIVMSTTLVFLLLLSYALSFPWIVYIFLLSFGVWTAVVAYNFVTGYEAFSSKLNKTLYQLIFDYFNLSVAHTDDDDMFVGESAKNSLLKDLTQSQLITERVDTYKLDDMAECRYQEQPLVFGELYATRTEGSGKNRRTVTVFKGVFVKHTLPKSFTGDTFVSTEGDKYGFGHRSFWSSITNSTNVSETELEWNEFEKDLHVATTDATEARYILTPEFMAELYSWWRGSMRNIRISFKENQFYMLFPDSKIKFGTSTLSSKSADLFEYALTIATPIWHVLNLLDDVRRRFR